MAVQDFELLNRAVLADDGVQTHGAGDAGLARQRRINRLDTVDVSRCLDGAADAERAGLLGLRAGGGSPPRPPRRPRATTPRTSPTSPPAEPRACRRCIRH